MKIRIFLFIGICLIITSFFPVTIAAQDNLPYCLRSHDLGACLSKEDKQRFLGKKIEDVWVSFDTTIGTGEIRLLNSHNEALQEYDKVIAEKRNEFQRHIIYEHDRIDTQDLSVGSKSILLSFMQTTSFFGAGGVSMKDSNTEGLGWTRIPEISITAFVQDNCLVYFGGGVSLRGYGNNYIDYHKVDKHGRSVEYWQIINTHPNFDHGKQYLIDQSTELAKVFSKNIKGKCNKTGQKENTQQTQNPILPPYAVCAIRCLDDIDQRYQCPLPASIIDDNGVSVIVLPDGSTRNFSPRDNECVNDRGKIQSACLSQCPAAIGGEPMSDPIDEGEKIKVAGAASDDPLNEAEKYIDLLRRKPDLTRKEEDIKRILGDYGAGKPVSVWDVKGEPEMQVPGSDEWVTLKKGDAIPPGARVFTGMDDDLLVSLPGVYIVKVRSLTDITFSQTGISNALSKGELITHLDLRTGDVEVQVEKGSYQASMQVKMPQAVVGVRGTHFWVSYDETKRLGVAGVYEGEVAVDNLFRGTRTLLTPAKDKTPRVIVMASAKTNSQPQTQEPISTPGQEEQVSKTSANIFVPLLFILTAGSSVLYVLHKKGMLIPMYKKYSQKVIILMKKTSKSDKEKETDKDS